MVTHGVLHFDPSTCVLFVYLDNVTSGFLLPVPQNRSTSFSPPLLLVALVSGDVEFIGTRSFPSFAPPRRHSLVSPPSLVPSIAPPLRMFGLPRRTYLLSSKMDTPTEEPPLVLALGTAAVGGSLDTSNIIYGTSKLRLCHRLSSTHDLVCCLTLFAKVRSGLTIIYR
jgi:hypothetical protein